MSTLPIRKQHVEGFVPLARAAVLLRVSNERVGALLCDGALAGARIDGNWLVAVRSLRAYAEQRADSLQPQKRPFLIL